MKYLATDLIDDRFEGYDQILIDSDLNNRERYCAADRNIEYSNDILADFHIDFVQHYERIRQHSNHIQLENIKHENEGYYECIVRLHNGLVGVRVFFLSGRSFSFMCRISSLSSRWWTTANKKSRNTYLFGNEGFDYFTLSDFLRNTCVVYIHQSR